MVKSTHILQVMVTSEPHQSGFTRAPLGPSHCPTVQMPLLQQISNDDAKTSFPLDNCSTAKIRAPPAERNQIANRFGII